jgi:Fe-Mn family superoxide dismutase
MTHTITKPTFNYNALEPYFDAATMELHTEKHHQGYADKLNAALTEHPELQGVSLKELASSDILAIKNPAGGVLNHDFFWSILSPKFDQPVPEMIKPLIPQFTDTATKLFGSGWAWIVKIDEKLQVISTANQDFPEGTPILALDLWEHAYYLKYQNRRAEYIEAYWHVVNWTEVNKLML